MSKRNGKRLPPILERQEVDTLLDAVNTRCPTGLRNRVCLEVMYRAGLRLAEVIDLGKVHVLFNDKVLEVHSGKGDMDRNIPIHPKLLPWLSLWYEKRPKSKRFFCTLKGKPLQPAYLQAMIKRMGARAGIERMERVHCHTLRHCCATEWIEEGFTMPEVKMLLGHSVNTNTSLYLHARPKNIADKMAAL